MKRIKVVKKTLDLQIRFCSFFVHDSSTGATEFARKSPKFPWGPKLEAFMVVVHYIMYLLDFVYQQILRQKQTHVKDA